MHNGKENHNMSLTLAKVLTSSEEALSETLPLVQNQVAVEKAGQRVAG